MRAALPNIDDAGSSEPCEMGTYQVFDRIITTNPFTTKTCREVFKIQSGPFNINSEKVLYLLRCKICDDTPTLEKLKQRFVFGLIIIKVNTNFFKKENRIYHRSIFMHTMFKTATEVLIFGK